MTPPCASCRLPLPPKRRGAGPLCPACRRRRSQARSAARLRGRRRAADCRHCGRRRVSRARGLCWACYASPAAQAAFPPANFAGSREAPDKCGGYDPPAEATGGPPGSEAKLRALAARAAAGVALWHRDDKPEWDGPPAEPGDRARFRAGA